MKGPDRRRRPKKDPVDKKARILSVRPFIGYEIRAAKTVAQQIFHTESEEIMRCSVTSCQVRRELASRDISPVLFEPSEHQAVEGLYHICLLYTSDAADD